MLWVSGYVITIPCVSEVRRIFRPSKSYDAATHPTWATELKRFCHILVWGDCHLGLLRLFPGNAQRRRIGLSFKRVKAVFNDLG